MCGRGLRRLLLIISFFAVPAIAAEDFPAFLPKTVKPISRVNPYYPIKSLKKNVEGWVLLSFVVMPQGDVSDVIVVNSSHSGFEASASAALSRWKYDPVTVQVGPTGASFETMLKFQLENSDHSAVKFKDSYSQIDNLLKAGKLDDAEKQFQDVAGNDHHSVVGEYFYHWLRYRLFTLKNEPAAAYDALRNFLLLSDFAPKDFRLAGLAAAFTYAVNNNELEDAKSLLKQLKTSESLQSEAEYQSIMQQLAATETELTTKLASDMPLQIKGAVFLSTYWPHTLTHHEFSLTNVAGALQGIEARCRNAQGKHLEVLVDSDYKIPDSWGLCTLYIQGEPGSSFTLIEHPPAATAEPANTAQ